MFDALHPSPRERFCSKRHSADSEPLLRQTRVTAHFKSKQLLLFAFTNANCSNISLGERAVISICLNPCPSWNYFLRCEQLSPVKSKGSTFTCEGSRYCLLTLHGTSLLFPWTALSDVDRSFWRGALCGFVMFSSEHIFRVYSRWCDVLPRWVHAPEN